MTTVAGTTTQPGPDHRMKLVVWSAVLNGNDGSPFKFVMWADRTVQITGTFGAGGSVSIEGSNEDPPVNWSVLTDSSGAAMTYSSASLKQMNEAPLWVRPHVTAGDGTTSLVVSLLARRAVL